MKTASRGTDRFRFERVFPVACAILFGATIPVVAQEGGYKMPPKAVADLIDAPPTPGVSVGPNKTWMVLSGRPSMPPIAEVSQPEVRIGGFRINPRTNGRSRARHSTSLTLKRISDGMERPITELPKNPRIGSVRWSPDGKRIAFTIAVDTGIELWAAEVATGRANRLTAPRLAGAYGSPFTWAPDSQTLICRFIPPHRGDMPTMPTVPAGPIVQENQKKRAAARTYQDLLKNKHDEALFDHFLTCRVARVTLGGRLSPMGPAAVITRAAPSPDGKHILVETMHKPYSYLVPASRFPHRVEIWDSTGKVVKVVADLPLADEVPIGFGAVPTGPRSFGWRADVGSTLYWTEAQDGGDPKKKAEVRDRVFTLAAPFSGDAVALVSLGLRYRGITWGHQNLALVTESWWRTRTRKTWIVDPSKPGSEPSILWDRSYEDRYSDPGRPMMRRTPRGTSVLMTSRTGNSLFLTGNGSSPEGDRPFLDRLDLGSRETTRLWRSQSPYYESAISLLDPESLTLMTRRESKTEPPNYFVRKIGTDNIRAITNFPHPQPQLANVYTEMIRYKRADGVDLTATLYLPPGKKPSDGPFPMFAWAYPREFKSAASASQMSGSPHRFVRTSSSSPLLWLVHGYAVWNNFSLPIIGEGDKEPNDTFVKQLVAGAQAAVDEAVRRGVADRDRVAIGGHSYGAFMTANLLAHSDIFRAGIARSGAYNRTLTPFGFQSEERTFWEAPEIYFAMSPFMHADKVNEPLLLVHGEADNNSGTFPIQSRRYYAALKGHGAVTRLVMLPNESHGYRARESLMHLAAETTEWLDKYVKNAGPRK